MIYGFMVITSPLNQLRQFYDCQFSTCLSVRLFGKHAKNLSIAINIKLDLNPIAVDNSWTGE